MAARFLLPLICAFAAASVAGAAETEPRRDAPRFSQDRPPIAQPKIDCSCRHAGGKARIGETICVRRRGGAVTLRCEMTLNNTSWRELGPGCEPVS